MTARQVSVRLTVDLIENLDKLADDEGVSRNAILEVAAYESLSRWEDEGGVPREAVLRVMRDKKQRTRAGLLRSQNNKKRGEVHLD